MPVLTAVRTIPGCAPTTGDCWPRGKLPKVALVACMRKLLLAIYSVAKHRRPFTPCCPPRHYAPRQA